MGRHGSDFYLLVYKICLAEYGHQMTQNTLKGIAAQQLLQFNTFDSILLWGATPDY